MTCISYKIGRRKVCVCVYIKTVPAETCGSGIEGGLRLGIVHGQGADDLILVAISGF